MNHQNESHDDNCTEHEFASKTKKKTTPFRREKKAKHTQEKSGTVENTLCYRAFTAVGKSSARGKLH